MEQHLTEKQREEMQDIMESMSYPLDFVCYKSSPEDICKAEYSGHGLVCKINEMPTVKSTPYFDCKYRLYLSGIHNYYICTCRLRIYIAKNLNL